MMMIQAEPTQSKSYPMALGETMRLMEGLSGRPQFRLKGGGANEKTNRDIDGPQPAYRLEEKQRCDCPVVLTLLGADSHAHHGRSGNHRQRQLAHYLQSG